MHLRFIPIPHPGLGEDPVLLFRLPGGWQACSDSPFCRSLGNGRAATLPQSSNGRHRRNSSSWRFALPLLCRSLYVIRIFFNSKVVLNTSVIALVQTHIYAKKQNSRDLAVRKKQIQPIFSVEIIDIDQQLPGTTEAVGLYSSSNFPKHRNVHIRIENVAELPIRNVIIFDRYYFQLLKPNEPKDIYVVYSDSPDAGTKVAVIARILETEYERTERGIPKWFNINFEDVDGNESFQTFTLENFEGVQYYSLKSTEEI